MKGTLKKNKAILEKINFQGNPARKTIVSPEAPIIIAVPKSGCFRMTKKGIIIVIREKVCALIDILF